MEEIAKLGTIVAIWAHPDDESWCAGGILAAAIDNGQRVVCITATKGEAGEQHDLSKIGKPVSVLREHELQRALDVLGIQEHIWLDYFDGECDKVNDTEAVNKMLPALQAVNPNTILTFGPDGLTGHPDHQAVSRWTDLAVQRAKLDAAPQVFHKVESEEYYHALGEKIGKQFNIYFMTDQPPLVPEAKIDLAFHLPDNLIKRKLEALEVQSSQMKHIFELLTPDELRQMVDFEGFMTTSKSA